MLGPPRCTFTITKGSSAITASPPATNGAANDVPFVIALEAGLSFLGLGVRPPTPSWGSILNDGYTYIRNSSWILFSAGAPLILVTIGFTFLGEQLRDILDPKIGRGR